MHLWTSIRVALSIAASLGVSACDRDIPQTIVGTLASHEGPVAHQTLRLYASYPECDGTFLESTTDDAGRFRFTTRSTRGGMSVVTQSIALCTEVAGTWSPVWATVTGGGARTVNLTCMPRIPDDPFVKFCEVKADYSE